MSKTTWRKLLRKATGGRMVNCTMTGDEMDVEFRDGLGSGSGIRFTAWTSDRVFFPVVYDGSQSVGSAPRNPCDEATRHQGGGGSREFPGTGDYSPTEDPDDDL